MLGARVDDSRKEEEWPSLSNITELTPVRAEIIPTIGISQMKNTIIQKTTKTIMLQLMLKLCRPQDALIEEQGRELDEK